LANIKFVAANIVRGAAAILYGLAIILRGMPAFEAMCMTYCMSNTNFWKFWDFQREKYTFFQKCSKIGLVAKKMIITF